MRLATLCGVLLAGLSLPGCRLSGVDAQRDMPHAVQRPTLESTQPCPQEMSHSPKSDQQIVRTGWSAPHGIVSKRDPFDERLLPTQAATKLNRPVIQTTSLKQPPASDAEDSAGLNEISPVDAAEAWGLPETREGPSIAAWPTQQLSLEDDAELFFSRLGDDAAAVVNCNNAVILGSSLAGAIAIRQNLDADVRMATQRHPERWGEGTKVLGKLGEFQFQVPVLMAVYGLSLKRQDERLHEFSHSLISAYTITGLSTLVAKSIANTDRPTTQWNGGQFGFPSFHVASSFSIAAVLDEYYGSRVGLPAYTLAGLIGWSRIDERDHDLSDVFFGAALGCVIGKAVAGQHLRADSRVRLLPYFHPTDATSGLLLDVAF